MIILWIFMVLVVLAAIIIAFNRKYKVVFTIKQHNKNLDMYLDIKRLLYINKEATYIVYYLVRKYNINNKDGYQIISYAQNDNIEFFKELGR